MKIFGPHRNIILLLLGLIFLLIVILIIQQGSSKISKTDNPPEPSTTLQEAKITQVNPAQNTVLIPGTQQTFSFQFSIPINKASFEVSVYRKDLISDEPSQTEEISASLKDNNQTLEIRLQNPIKSYSSYEVNLLDSSSHSKLYTTDYLTDEPAATKAPTNNSDLKQYLPQKTSNYILEYDQDLNIYLFHFIYNPESSSSLQTQYDQAKQAATNFIQSKGIDIDSITIEWKYS